MPRLPADPDARGHRRVPAAAGSRRAPAARGWARPGLWVLLLLPLLAARAEDGYRLWLRYDLVPDAPHRARYVAALPQVTFVTPTGAESATLAAARREITDGLAGLLGHPVPVRLQPGAAPAGAADGFTLSLAPAGGVAITSASDVGVLYGVFDLLRRLQTGRELDRLPVASAPRIQRRLLNHWDNLNRFVERGYAGASLWEWFALPDYRSPRYRDYARACASVGLNGTVLNNVNADALVLTPAYLAKVAALADEFRPYGIRVYLSARFTAPMELGGLKTADPLDPAVAAWWRQKVDEIYRAVPDFGGFLVKANSEGQPGPQDYGRTHADGANVLADALAPHDGIVLWRAFVYRADNTLDRVRQAYREFAPLDGRFRPNVVVQLKNGPLDFMPREPFHPLFGAMPHTALALECQVTQEYLGGAIHAAYLGPMWQEVLAADTRARRDPADPASGEGATVARIIDGSWWHSRLTVIAGVANTGTDRNWTGHPLAQANWYAFGRLAWDHTLDAAEIAGEWTRMTFGSDPQVVEPLTRLLLGSRETVVDYSMPLGLHHIMAEGHHYGPGPWATHARKDWCASYYHQADEVGLGANRGPAGSNAVADYAPELAAEWGRIDSCPEALLLWFNHVPWDYRLPSGRILWDELCFRYQRGVEGVRAMQRDWAALAGRIDRERFEHVAALLARQERDARDWRDACLLYFGQFSHRALPAGVEPPAHDLAFYEAVRLRHVPGHPGDP